MDKSEGSHCFVFLHQIRDFCSNGFDRSTFESSGKNSEAKTKTIRIYFPRGSQMSDNFLKNWYIVSISIVAVLL